MTFSKLRDRIPTHLQKRLFLEVYQRNEYGFGELDQTMVHDILNLDLDENGKHYDIRHVGVKPDKKGYFTIYRGITPKSSPTTKAYSWTLDLKVAEFFATRFNSKGYVLKAKVHIDNVKAYLADRNESEVIVLPNDVENMRKIKTK